MPYDVTMIQLNATDIGGFSTGVVSAPTLGFPAGDFDTMLYSQWMCGPPVSGVTPSEVAPSLATGITIFSVQPSAGLLYLGNGVAGQFFTGSFTGVLASLRTHMLLSVNTATRTIQLYLNDQLVTVSGTWTGTAGSNHFNVGTGSLIFQWLGEHATITIPPGVADIWCGTSASDAFVDLSIAVNRRKFINHDLTPVDLGTTGSSPFGYVPQVWSTVRSGGAPNDLLNNRGTGPDFTLHSGITLAFQAGGVCTLPPPPPPEGGSILSAPIINPEPQFCDADGHPYAGGTIETYVTGTTTPKQTWTDPGLTALNTNPIVLDSAGRCVMWGDGDYRLILRDAVGNLIWDQAATTIVSAAMEPVVSAPTIADAKALLGIDGSISDEATARANADTAETNARIAADNTLTTNLAAEVTRAEAAETALDGRVTTLEGAAGSTGLPGLRWGAGVTDGTGAAHITFSPAFSATPAVVATQMGPTSNYTVTVGSVSSSGTTIYIYLDAGSGVSGQSFWWIAAGLD